MNPLIWLALVVSLVLLAWDWLVKKRRVAARPEMEDQEFLKEYRGSGSSPDDERILRVRRQVARELGLPESKLRPDDRLTELRDDYCLVVSGHLALGDLFDDLNAAREDEASKTPSYPDTLRDYIAAFLDRTE